MKPLYDNCAIRPNQHSLVDGCLGVMDMISINAMMLTTAVRIHFDTMVLWLVLMQMVRIGEEEESSSRKEFFWNEFVCAVRE